MAGRFSFRGRSGANPSAADDSAAVRPEDLVVAKELDQGATTGDDPGQPVIAGRVYNEAAGGGFNEIRFEDVSGSESVPDPGAPSGDLALTPTEPVVGSGNSSCWIRVSHPGAASSDQGSYDIVYPDGRLDVSVEAAFDVEDSAEPAAGALAASGESDEGGMLLPVIQAAREPTNRSALVDNVAEEPTTMLDVGSPSLPGEDGGRTSPQAPDAPGFRDADAQEDLDPQDLLEA